MNSRESFTMISVTFLALLFMMITMTYVLAEPIDDVYASLLASDMGDDVNSYRDNYIPYYRSATILVFALAVAMPFGYIVAKVFSRESYIDPYDRYRRF